MNRARRVKYEETENVKEEQCCCYDPGHICQTRCAKLDDNSRRAQYPNTKT